MVVAAAVDISTEEGEEGEERETGEVCCFSLREDNRGVLSDHGLLKPDISNLLQLQGFRFHIMAFIKIKSAFLPFLSVLTLFIP